VICWIWRLKPNWYLWLGNLFSDIFFFITKIFLKRKFFDKCEKHYWSVKKIMRVKRKHFCLFKNACSSLIEKVNKLWNVIISFFLQYLRSHFANWSHCLKKAWQSKTYEYWGLYGWRSLSSCRMSSSTGHSIWKLHHI